MSLLGTSGATRVPEGPRAGWDPLLPDVVLAPGAVADLLLGLWGLLPAGTELGGTTLGGTSPPGGVGVAAARTVMVRLASEEAARTASLAGGLVLRDEESTPLALLEQPVQQGDGTEVVGTLRGLRTRELGESSGRAVDLADPSLRGRAVLFLSRPATAADAEDLRTWSGWRGAPLLLVPEQAASRRRLATASLLAMAERLAQEQGAVGAEVRTVPLDLREPQRDDALVAALAGALGSPSVRLLTDTAPAGSAAEWGRAREQLVLGTGDPCAALASGAEVQLRDWMPPRSRRGLTIMFTGLSGSGKSTIARDVARWLEVEAGRAVTILDGDRVRRLLSSGLGFDLASRELNLRRIGFVAAEVARHGGVAICSPIAPTASIRAEVRRMAEQTGDFLLVHVSTPLAECERRDLKGLYALARAGTLREFTGISSPYEEPEDADLRVDTSVVSREVAAGAVADLLRCGGWADGGPR
jgi:adenylyl-sulfate kinase